MASEQVSLFASSPAPVESDGGVRSRRRAAVGRWSRLSEPFGKPDRKGKYWYERWLEDVSDLPEDDRSLLLEMCIEWPVTRHDNFRHLIDRWIRAQPLERDNVAQAMGK